MCNYGVNGAIHIEGIEISRHESFHLMNGRMMKSKMDCGENSVNRTPWNYDPFSDGMKGVLKLHDNQTVSGNCCRFQVFLDIRD